MSLYTRLEPLKLYKLRQDSLIDCELAAFEVAFDLIHAALADIENSAFVQTSTGNALAMHEKLVGLGERQSVSLPLRRALVLYRRSIAPFDFNLNGMMSSIQAAGLEADIVEYSADEKLKIISKKLLDDFYDLDGVKLSLFKMLPAHLEAEFDIGILTWDMFDEKAYTFDAFDALDFTWEEFDINGDKILV